MSEQRNQQIEAELTKVAEFIKQQNDEILKGSEKAIKDMEGVIVGFCKFAGGFPPDNLMPFKEDIEFLSEYLHRISLHLNLRREDVMRQLEELKSRQRAAAAYGRAGRKGEG